MGGRACSLEKRSWDAKPVAASGTTDSAKDHQYRVFHCCGRRQLRHDGLRTFGCAGAGKSGRECPHSSFSKAVLQTSSDIVSVRQLVRGQPAFLTMTPGGGVNVNSESGAM